MGYWGNTACRPVRPDGNLPSGSFNRSGISADAAVRSPQTAADRPARPSPERVKRRRPPPARGRLPAPAAPSGRKRIRVSAVRPFSAGMSNFAEILIIFVLLLANGVFALAEIAFILFALVRRPRLQTPSLS